MEIKKTILIVDDSAHMRAMLRLPLTKAGYEIVGEAEDGQEAIRLVKELRPDVVMLDNILPDMHGCDVFKVMKKEKIDSSVIMVSSIKKESLIEKLKCMGIVGYIVKPFEVKHLLKLVARVTRVPVLT